jgi:hypothetical protein
MSRLTCAVVLGLTFAAAGCDESPTSPSGAAIARISVNGEAFRVQLVDDRQIAAARAAQSGATARIPSGRIVAGSSVNTGWGWHLEDVEFVEAAIELCDGRPSDVERQGVQFGGGRFCPWSSRVESVVTGN